jgi:hypothetical protein
LVDAVLFCHTVMIWCVVFAVMIQPASAAKGVDPPRSTETKGEDDEGFTDMVAGSSAARPEPRSIVEVPAKVAAPVPSYAQQAGDADAVAGRIAERLGVGSAMRLNTVEYFKEHVNEVHGVMTVGGESFRGSVVVLGIGLQDMLDFDLILREVYGPVIAHAKARGDVRVLCMALPAPDEAKKPEAFRKAQGRAAIERFNEQVRRFCSDRGAEMLELFAPTANATIVDWLRVK